MRTPQVRSPRTTAQPMPPGDLVVLPDVDSLATGRRPHPRPAGPVGIENGETVPFHDSRGIVDGAEAALGIRGGAQQPVDIDRERIRELIRVTERRKAARRARRLGTRVR